MLNLAGGAAAFTSGIAIESTFAPMHVSTALL
jgi:hypothetical protein